MRLNPLPDLSGALEEEERDAVIELAVAGLLPHAIQKKNAIVERAILRRMMEWLTDQPEQSGRDLRRLLHALRNMPGETFQGYRNERKTASAIADGLESGFAGDPLYSGPGNVFDPAALLDVGPMPSRISVISLFGLPDFMIRAHFVAQFSSILFNWFRKHPPPAAGSPPSGLLVLEDAAPFLSRLQPESKPGLTLLAKCASKYGFGLIVATENPKDMDLDATEDYATQVFGSATAAQLLRSLSHVSGLEVRGLKAGQFVFVTPSADGPIRFQV